MNEEIIIVDDDRSIRKSLDLALSNYHYPHKVFERPSDARAYLEQTSQPPLMYLVDMRMPGELEGSEELFNYVFENNLAPERFFFMTGHVSGHDREVLERTGAPVFEKPFSLIWLRNYIDNMIKELDSHYSSTQ